MTLTPEQIELRRHAVGASDVPAILGLSPWATPYDIWARKTGRVDDTAGPAAHAGNRFEAGVLDEAEAQLGPLTRNVRLVHPTRPLAVNLDAYLTMTGEPVEAKTAGLFSPLGDDWGEEGTDEIPEAYLLQVQAELIVCRTNQAYLQAFLGGRGFRLYRISANPDLRDIIEQAVDEFWGLVQSDTPPADTGPSKAVAKAMRRTPGKAASVAPAAIAAWLEARDALRDAEEREIFYKSAIFAALGDAEESEDTPAGAVTYHQQSRQGLDAKALEAAHPEIAGQFQRTTAYRVFRFRKPRAAK